MNSRFACVAVGLARASAPFPSHAALRLVARVLPSSSVASFATSTGARPSKWSDDPQVEQAVRDMDSAVAGGGDWPITSRAVRERPLWMVYEDQLVHADNSGKEGSGRVAKFENPTLIKVPMLDSLGRAYATGRRKTSAARVWVYRGDGKVTVNGQPFLEYFPRISHRVSMLEPFTATQSFGAFDVWLTVKGGGMSGQAGAARHGIARALTRFDPVMSIPLKQGDMLRRDPRMVERKKPGQKKARKKFQWVKR